MTRSRHAVIVATTLALFLLSAAIGAEPAKVAFADRDDGGHEVRGANYVAVVDKAGNMTSLKVRGVEFLKTTTRGGKTWRGGEFPGEKPAERVRREGETLEITGNHIVVKYTFLPRAIKVRTEGGHMRFGFARPDLFIASDGVTRAGDANLGDIRKVRRDGVTIGFSRGFHHYYGTVSPSDYYGRGHGDEEPIAYRIDLGVDVDGGEMLLEPTLSAKDHDATRVPRVEPGETITLRFASRNPADEPVQAELVWTVRDQLHRGSDVVERRVDRVSFPASAKEPTAFTFTPGRIDEPGAYWVRAELKVDGETRKAEAFAFVYDAAGYKPPLTRPDDFQAFWEKQVAAMRAIAFDADLVENPKLSTADAIWYDLTITMADGERHKGALTIPRKPGRYVAYTRYVRPEPDGKRYGRWKKEAGEGVYLGVAPPRQSTYTHWRSRTDNNMRESILHTLRLLDYLRSRDEVSELVVTGASRGGPTALIAAALDPTRIRYVDAHVPTSMGLSWREDPYFGWGSRGDLRGDDWYRVAAYFDPVNFAPMLEVPYLIDGGIYDGLSPVPGMLAFHNHAANAPFGRLSIEPGQHGYFRHSPRRRWMAELETFLEDWAPPGSDR